MHVESVRPITPAAQNSFLRIRTMKAIAVAVHAAFAVLVCLCLAGPAQAQNVGAIAGTVVDATGGVVPGLTAVLSNPGAIGADQQTTTGARGAEQVIRLV